MAEATQEELEILLEMKNFQKKMDAINTLFTTSIKNATNLGQVVDAISTKIDNLSKAASKANKTVNNTRNDYQNSTFTNQNNFLNAAYAATSATGASMVSPTGSDKAFKDFQKAQIDETNARIELTNEIKEDTKEQKRLRKYRANTERISANAAQTKANKSEDQTTAEYIADRAKIADAKLLNAKAKQAGAFNSNWRYQIGRGVTQVGDKLSTTGTIGRLSGDLLSVVGKSIISPASAAGLAIAKLGEGVLDFAKAATTAYAEIESIKTQLGVVFSSQTQADSMFSELSAYAVKSPFGVQQTSELAVLLKQSGVEASKLMDTLRMLGDTAGGNMEKMKRIANNYAQIISIGKASMLDMRQFAYAGIPIFEAVSKELNVSQSRLRELISDGKVSAEIIEKVFKNLTGVNGIFENATEQGSKTLKARLQNMADAKQLSMASVGELITSLGTNTGNDSFANNLVDTVEGIYSWLKDFAGTKNIENSVKVIERRNARIEQLENLIEYAKANGQDEAVKRLQETLARELSKRDYEKERSQYNESYLAKKTNETRLYELGVFDINNRAIDKRISDLRSMDTAFFSLARKKSELDFLNLSQTNSPLKEERKSQLENDIKELEEIVHYLDEETVRSMISELEDLRLKIDEAITETEKYKHWETENLKAQSDAFDLTSLRSKETSSLNKSFEELASMYMNQEEVKQKQEEERLQILKAAQKELMEISKHTDKDGTVKMTELSPTEYLRLLDNGAFTTGRKLNFVEGKNERLISEDREMLAEQVSWALSYIQSEIEDNLSLKGTDNIVQLLQSSPSLLNSELNDKDFIKNFNKVYYLLRNSLTTLVKNNPDNKTFNDLVRILDETTFTREVNDKGVNADLAKNLKGDIHIPLWKRIVANATGWDASLVGDSGSGFIDKYSNQAARNIVTGGVQGLVSSGTMAGDILSRMRYDAEQNKQGVRQINWKKTESDMIKDALSLRDGVKMSASALSGLSKALESQLSVYEKLTVDMIGVGEDWSTIQNSLKKKFANNPYLKEGDFLDNAFQASAKNIGGYSLGYDSEFGMIVKDSTGDFKGSVEELKRSSNTLSGDLKKFVDSIKVDTIVEALDNLRKSTMSLNDTVRLTASIANQSADWDKQSGQVWGKSLGGTIGGIAKLLDANAKITFDYFQKLSSVNLATRPQIPWERMEAAGWHEEGAGGTATVYSNTKTNKDFGITYEDGEKIAVNITPILPDGTVLSPNELDDWVRNLFESGNFNSEIVLGVYKGENSLEKAEADAEKLHVNQAQIFGLENPVNSLSPEAQSHLSDFLSSFAGDLMTIDTDKWDEKAIKKQAEKAGNNGDLTEEQVKRIRESVKGFQDAGGTFETLQKVFEAMGRPFEELVSSAERLVAAEKEAEAMKSADDILRNSNLSFMDSQDATKSIKNLAMSPSQIDITDSVRAARANGNSFNQQVLLSQLGYGNQNFSDVSKALTANAFASKDQRLLEGYKNAGNDFIAKQLGNDDFGKNFQNEFTEAFNTGDLEKARNIIQSLGGDFDQLAASVNQSAMETGTLGASFVELGSSLGGTLKEFAGSAISSSFETLGKAAAESADSGKALKDNFKALGSGLMQNMGTMMTQAGLAMIIGSMGIGPKFYAGLALVVAGMGAPFLGGMLGAKDDADESGDDEYQRLSRIKDDLVDLLKQAREDAIYYENTLRHKNAISANDSFTQKKVNDAIITPSGDIISTHPDDYLIATKTPQTLLGSGAGAPTINFSVIDKSTGIKVTQQKSTYNEDDNSIDFTAIIESKVNEIIASSKGDDAFAAREARLRGRSVIA